MFVNLNKCNLEKNILKANNICLEILRSGGNIGRILLPYTELITGGAIALILQNIGAIWKNNGEVLLLANSAGYKNNRIYHEKYIGPETRMGEEAIPEGGVPPRFDASAA